MMPQRLVILRHGESISNLTHRMYREGNFEKVPEKWFGLHTNCWPLTNDGISQAEIAGDRVRNLFPGGFDIGYVSWYLRALETAYHLKLPNLYWKLGVFIRERNWGDLDYIPTPDEWKILDKVVEKREDHRFFWIPQNGDSMATTVLSIDRWFSTLHRDNSDHRVLAVMHGEAMQIVRFILEKLWPSEVGGFQANPDEKMENCHMLVYSRIDPKNNSVSPYLTHVRSISPKLPLDHPGNAWRKIIKRKYQTGDLKKIIDSFPKVCREF